MKAIAKKIKDNEWIAEVLEKVMIIRGNRYMRDRHDTVPEPALCDKDGNYYYLDIKTYPIVSPSDKEWLEKNNMDGKEVEITLTTVNGNNCARPVISPIHSDPAGEPKPLGLDENGKPYYLQYPSTPQTGRTYTEGEVIDFANKCRGQFVGDRSTQSLLNEFNSKP